MRRRFIVIFLVGGLMLGLCGCGSDAAGGVDAYAVQENQEETPAQDNNSQTSEPAGVAGEAMPERRCLEGYSVDELVGMLSSGELAMADIEYNVATGDVSYEDYEEILGIVSPAQEGEVIPEQSDAQADADESPEKPETRIDPADCMSTYVWEHEDANGYQLRETISLSPIFANTDEDMEAMYAIWEALGGTTDEIPSKDELYEMSQPLRSFHKINHFNSMKYIIGVRTIHNLTDGFPITADNPYTVGNVITVDSTIDSPDADGNAETCITSNATTLLFYDSGRKCEVSTPVGIPLGGAKMTSDTWGPVRFLVVLPDDVTPNRPDGFAYDSLQYMIGTNPNLIQNKVNFTLHNWSE